MNLKRTTLLTFSMLASLLTAPSVTATTSAAVISVKSVVTCTNLSTHKVRVVLNGACFSNENKVVYLRSTKSAVAGAIVICANLFTGAPRVLTKGSCSKSEAKLIWVKSTTTTKPTVTPTPTKTATASASPAKLSCAAGGVCARKDIGPGGGQVFYVADSPQSWGRYLEVAPANWNGSGADPKAAWCNIVDSLIATNFEIGTGASNTATLSATCSSSAAALAKAYRGGGKSDWYLPSYAEQNELHGFVYGQSIDGFAADYYWSSTQDSATNAWSTYFLKGGGAVAAKSSQFLVRPIRRF